MDALSSRSHGSILQLSLTSLVDVWISLIAFMSMVYVLVDSRLQVNIEILSENVGGRVLLWKRGEHRQPSEGLSDLSHERLSSYVWTPTSTASCSWSRCP
jgi:hypothetical protein